MARPKKILLGKCMGLDTEEGAAIVFVYQSGSGYSIRYDGKSHHCHPSITDIEKVKREIYHVFCIDTPTFEYI